MDIQTRPVTVSVSSPSNNAFNRTAPAAPLGECPSSQSGLSFVQGISRDLLGLQQQIAQVNAESRQSAAEVHAAIGDHCKRLQTEIERSFERIQLTANEQAAASRRVADLEASHTEAARQVQALTHRLASAEKALTGDVQERFQALEREIGSRPPGAEIRERLASFERDVQARPAGAEVHEAIAQLENQAALTTAMRAELDELGRNVAARPTPKDLHTVVQAATELQVKCRRSDDTLKNQSSAIQDIKNMLSHRVLTSDMMVIEERLKATVDRMDSAERALERTTEEMKRFVDRGDFESAARETKAGFRGASEAREHILGQLGTLDAELRRKLASDIFDTRTALEQEHRATVEKLERRAAESETAITSRLSVVEPMAREGLDQAAKLFQELASAKEEASAATQVVQVSVDREASRVKRLVADSAARPSADEENEALQRLQYLEAQLGLSRVAGSETQAKSAPDSGGGPQTSQGIAKMNFVARQSALESLIEQNRRDLEDSMHRHCLDLDGLSRKVWGDKVPDGPPLAMRLAASEDQVSDLWRHVGNKAEKEDMLQRLSFKSDIGHTHDRLVSADGVATFVL